MTLLTPIALGSLWLIESRTGQSWVKTYRTQDNTLYLKSGKLFVTTTSSSTEPYRSSVRYYRPNSYPFSVSLS